MPLFSYEASDARGKKLKASSEATDESALKEALRKKGLIPLSIEAVERRGLAAQSLRKISKKDLLRFTHELGNLLESGIPIDKALFILSEHSEKERMRAVIKKVYIDIQKGQSLSQAMAGHEVFPRLYVNMIRAGEAGGILEPVIRRLAAFLEMTASFREEVISALIYPILLAIVGGLAVAVLMLYVVPRFAQIFEDMGQALPAPTLILLKVSGWFVSYWWLMLGAAVLSFALLKTYAKTKEGRLFMDGLKLRMPVVKTLHMKFVIARFARTLGTLIQSGVPILEAIRISREVVGNEVISGSLQTLEEGVKKGRGVAGPLGESGVFPPIVVQMIAVGEEAGRLEETFLTVADRFEAESRNLIKRAVSLIEPAMILLMGLVVGFIVISMLIAVFSINEIPI
ncbi:MAG: type II secretion system F family protein [Thermodesulfovibrionales bacterium]|nr:type II secretion system F family protein [Thermodesulfovibrionales bacterium]